MPEITLKDIERVVEKGFEKQAVFINNVFQTHTDHFDKKLNGVEQGLRADIAKIDNRLEKVEVSVERVEAKVDRALHAEYVNLEVRVKRLEHHTGLKS